MLPAAVKITQKNLKISEAEYRQLVFNLGVKSSTELDDDGRRALVAAMYSFRRQQATDRPKSPQEGKIWALWYDLKGHLPAKEQTAQYLLGFCKRSSGATGDIKALRDLTPAQAHKAIEALKTRLERERTSINNDVPF